MDVNITSGYNQREIRRLFSITFAAFNAKAKTGIFFILM